MRRLALAFVIGLAVLPAVEAVTWADDALRPGGGQSFSGGFRSSSGGSGSWSGSRSYGGGGGDSGLGGYLLAFGLVAGIVITSVAVGQATQSAKKETWDSSPGAAPRVASQVAYDNIRAIDPDFSSAIFEDFVYALYARTHVARTDVAALSALAGYIAPDVRASLLARGPQGIAVHGVVVAAMVAVMAYERAGKIVVELHLESNVSAGERTYYLREQWSLERATSIRTAQPPTVFAFNCPKCGAAFQSTEDGRCAQCGEMTCDGRFDWSLTAVRLLHRETRPPALSSAVDEVGTDDPTIVDSMLPIRVFQLQQADPSVTPLRLARRLTAIYNALNEAWNAEDLARARPYISDGMYNYLAYWLAAYRAQGLKNTLTRAKLVHVVPAKLVRDRYFDAITLRIWALGLDHTVRREDGNHVAGSAKWSRRYSEYWTLIRGAGVSGVPASDSNCPNCGAAHRVNMAGNCEHCGTHLTRGEFDWVLSKIEQDESYAG